MNQDKKNYQIVHQELALDVYLKTLLDEIPDEDLETQKNAVEKTVQVKTQEVKKSPVHIEVFEYADKKTENSTKQLQGVKPKTEHKVLPLSVMPEWAQHEFQALFFKVDHLILATPLTELLRTIKIERKPTKIPGQPSWFMGLQDEHDSRVGILDTGQLVFGKNHGGIRDLEDNPYKSILITSDGKWGMACDEVLSISKLKPDQVRWRTLRKKRPWLIGTVIDELTAVIDIQQMVPHRRTR